MEEVEYVRPDFEIVQYSKFDVIATSGYDTTGGEDEGEIDFGDDFEF